MVKIFTLQPTLEQIVQDALKQKLSAQEQLYKRLAPKMLSICRLYCKDIHLAEDIMIMGFVKVFKYLNTFESKGNFEGWVRKIMVNESISYLRTQKPIYFMDDQNFEAIDYAPEALDLSIDDIQQVIDDLPESYRIVFNLYVVEGYKHQEIAEMLNITEGTSKSQLSRARKILQDNITRLRNYETKTR